MTDWKLWKRNINYKYQSFTVKLNRHQITLSNSIKVSDYSVSVFRVDYFNFKLSTMYCMLLCLPARLMFFTTSRMHFSPFSNWQSLDYCESVHVPPLRGASLRNVPCLSLSSPQFALHAFPTLFMPFRNSSSLYCWSYFSWQMWTHQGLIYHLVIYLQLLI